MDKDEAVLIERKIILDCDSNYFDRDEFKHPGVDDSFSVLYFHKKDSYSDIYFERNYGKQIT